MNNKKKLPSRAYLIRCFDYNHSIGKFRFKERPKNHFKSVGAWKSWNSRFKGKSTGHLSSLKGKKHLTLCINNVRYYAYRIAWKIHYRKEPKYITQKNGDGSDVRIKNLIEIEKKDIGKNQRNNVHRSKFTGVTWLEPHQKWTARIQINNKNIYLGVFEKFEDAVKARKKANRKYGFKANHGAARTI